MFANGKEGADDGLLGWLVDRIDDPEFVCVWAYILFPFFFTRILGAHIVYLNLRCYANGQTMSCFLIKCSEHADAAIDPILLNSNKTEPYTRTERSLIKKAYSTPLDHHAPANPHASTTTPYQPSPEIQPPKPSSHIPTHSPYPCPKHLHPLTGLPSSNSTTHHSASFALSTCPPSSYARASASHASL